MIIPDTQQRLEAAYEDLLSLVVPPPPPPPPPPPCCGGRRAPHMHALHFCTVCMMLVRLPVRKW